MSEIETIYQTATRQQALHTVVIRRGAAGETGEAGPSAYQSYLDTTTDDPPLSEAEWSEGGGVETFAELTDKATADIPAINTPLAAALQTLTDAVGTKAAQAALDALAATVATKAPIDNPTFTGSIASDGVYSSGDITSSSTLEGNKLDLTGDAAAIAASRDALGLGAADDVTVESLTASSTVTSGVVNSPKLILGDSGDITGYGGSDMISAGYYKVIFRQCVVMDHDSGGNSGQLAHTLYLRNKANNSNARGAYLAGGTGSAEYSFRVANNVDSVLFNVAGNGDATVYGNLTASATVTAADLVLSPSASVTPANNGNLVVEATSNTSVTIKLKGSDGTVRSVVLNLA
jgi:hypothetical protein